MIERSALVTGGARRVGKGIAEALAQAGYDLWLHYRSSRQAAESTAAELAARHGVNVRTVDGDLADPEAVESIFDRVGAHSPGLDLLVNSAASFHSTAFDAVDASALDRSLALNARAPHLCTRAALPLLRAAAERGGSAAVVSIGDLSGVVPWRGFVEHGVAKAALLHWTKIAALELAPQIRVNAVVPGAILPPPGETPESAEWRSRGEALPVGRCGEPRDVGRAVLYLAEASFVTGEILAVDGGEHLLGSTKR